MNALTALQDWYKSHCNDIWEHDYRVKIGTLDNPGWSVEINLADTNLEIFNAKMRTIGFTAKWRIKYLKVVVVQKTLKKFLMFFLLGYVYLDYYLMYYIVIAIFSVFILTYKKA